MIYIKTLRWMLTAFCTFPRPEAGRFVLIFKLVMLPIVKLSICVLVNYYVFLRCFR